MDGLCQQQEVQSAWHTLVGPLVDPARQPALCGLLHACALVLLEISPDFLVMGARTAQGGWRQKSS